jgi:hypothetical protein
VFGIPLSRMRGSFQVSGESLIRIPPLGGAGPPFAATTKRLPILALARVGPPQCGKECKKGGQRAYS